MALIRRSAWLLLLPAEAVLLLLRPDLPLRILRLLPKLSKLLWRVKGRLPSSVLLLPRSIKTVSSVAFEGVEGV